MVVVQIVRDGDVDLVPALVARLVSADQQDRGSAWIEGVEDAEGSAIVLDPRLPQVRMPGALDLESARKPEMRSVQLQQPNDRGHGVLLIFSQRVPPLLQLVRVLHFP